MWTRAMRQPEDRAGVTALDTAFTSNAVMAVRQEGRAFHLTHTPVPMFTKRFELDDLDEGGRMWDDAIVGGRTDSALEAFLAWRFETWNRRLAIWHLYVAPPARRHGLARALMGEVEVVARRRGAVALWLEVSNVNVPAILAYEALGFSVVGLDTSLYWGTPARDETALFMSKDLR